MPQEWRTPEALVEARHEIERTMPAYIRPAAYALGIAIIGPSGVVLDTMYPTVNLGTSHLLPAAVLAAACGYETGTAVKHLDPATLTAAIERLAPAEACVEADHPNLRAWRTVRDLAASTSPPGGHRAIVAAFIGSLDDPLVDAHDAYFRLHLLSHRLVKPHGTNLDGIFSMLSTVVWTDLGPFEPGDFGMRRLELEASGRRPRVLGVDKFPRMLDYVVPSGVRVADASRVRLGAHLADGTVVMHEGFCNYNAGTLGPAMVEGRISAGVVVGADTDLGGSSSIMGMLSGGGKEVISVGRNCLLGANAGIGISLGDDCIVEAGLYVTAGSVVRLPDGTTTKAGELSGRPNLLYRRNSQSGAIEVLARDATLGWTGLNPDLHT
jgi:2,3,4,5-tetrahydropyridine-2-carboxylate N-succinyltransferase